VCVGVTLLIGDQHLTGFFFEDFVHVLWRLWYSKS
jgi:hypothetical protein